MPYFNSRILMFLNRTIIAGPLWICRAMHSVGRSLVGLLVDDFGRHRFIDEVLQVIAVGHDTEVIPLAGMDAGGRACPITESDFRCSRPRRRS